MNKLNMLPFWVEYLNKILGIPANYYVTTVVVFATMKFLQQNKQFYRRHENKTAWLYLG